MAPNLAAFQRADAWSMIAEGHLEDKQIGKAIGCSRNAVGAIRANIQCYGTTTALRNVPSELSQSRCASLFSIIFRSFPKNMIEAAG